MRTKGWELIPLAYGLILSIREYYKVDDGPIFPDTRNFLDLVRIFPTDSWWGGFREPVWATLLVGPVKLFGHEEIVARSFSMIGFLALIAVVQWAARAYWGRAWGVVAATAIAASPFLVFWSVSGLREETAAALVVGFGVIICRGPESRRGWLLLAAYAGVAALLRWDTVMLILPVFALAMLIRRVGWRTIVFSAAVFLAIVSPLVVGNAVRNDDPLYHSNAAAHFYRNYEFAGQPGYPSLKALQKDWFLGPRETWGEYIFGRHSAGEIARRVVKGPVFATLYISGLAVFGAQGASPPTVEPPTPGLILQSTVSIVEWLLLTGGVVGAVLMIRRGRWPFAMLLALAAVAHFPIVMLPGYDFRLEIVIWPLLVLANIEAATWVVTSTRSALRRAGGARRGTPTGRTSVDVATPFGGAGAR